MKIDFNKYIGHGTGYVIKTVYPQKDKLLIDTLVHGNAQVLPTIKKIEEDYFFDIASLTKFFTSIVVHRSIEKGLFTLDSIIKDLDDRFIYLDSVTVGGLLSHKQELWTDGYLGDATSKEEFYQMLFNAKVKTTKRTYIDSHYMILSIILEKIYQKSFAQIVDEEILRVLDLQNTSFKCPDNNKAVSNNYEIVKGEVVDSIYPGTVHDTKARVAAKLGISIGHAGLFTTAIDLIKILMSFIDDKYVLLSKESIDRMLSHDDASSDILATLQEYAIEMNIKISNNIDMNSLYDEIASKVDNQEDLLSKIIRPYNFGGIRYKNPLNAKNEIPASASDNSIIYSGYTGPIFFIDFDSKIIILIMTNVCHNSETVRAKRYYFSQKMVEEIYNQIILEVK